MNVRALRFLSLLTLVFAPLAASGCGDDSKFATLSVELAAAPAAGCSTQREEDLPATVTCISFEMCKRIGARCDPVALLRTGANHEGSGARVLRFERTAAFAFDTRATGGPFELTVTAYEGSDVYAVATTRGITIGSSVRVRLERVGDPADLRPWSCAPGPASGLPLARALHAATLLPSGEVLIYGGVLGADVDLNGVGDPAAKGAELQPAIEVYDPVSQRIVPVTRTGSFAWKGRVAFVSRLLPGPAAGPYVIALYGGYEADGTAALFLDANQSANETGSPIVPAEGVRPGVPLLLTYDPRAHSVAIVANPLDNPDASDTGFLAISGDLGAREEAVLVLGAGTFTVTPPGDPRATFAAVGRAFWLDSSGGIAGDLGSTALVTRRMGATVSRVDDATVFVWGGSVDEADNVGAVAGAGELLTRGGVSRALAGGSSSACPPPLPPVGAELPEPTAFHTATVIGDGQVVLAGGFLVAGENCTGRGITRLYPPHRPVAVVSFDATGMPTAATVPVPAEYAPTAFHTATLTPEGVVMVGGAAVVGTSRLESVRQVGVVRGDLATGYTFERRASLLVARWGHAATLLPGNRLLITGGFETYGAAGGTGRRARALDWSEVLPLTPPGPPNAECVDEPFVVADGGAADAGRRDGGIGDAGDAGETDAGEADAGDVDSGTP